MTENIDLLTIDCVPDATYLYSREDKRIPIFGSARQLAQHDLAIVKPALLYGDRVTLYSGNPLVASQIRHRAMRYSMAVPALTAMEQLATTGATEISGVPIPSGIIPNSNDFKKYLDRITESKETTDLTNPKWWKGATPDPEGDPRHQLISDALQAFSGPIAAFSDWIIEQLSNEEAELYSSELDEAIEQGILEMRGHLDFDLKQDVEAPYGLLLEEDVEDYSTLGAVQMLEKISESNSAIMLDEWSNDLIVEFGSGDVSRSTVDSASMVGVRLLSQFPRVQNATVSELIDLRTELSSPLIRLRAALISSTKDARSTSHQADIDDIVRTILIEEVAPSLLEIEEARQENTYIANLLGSVRDPKQLAAPVLTLAVSTAIGLPIFGALAIALGLSGPHMMAAWDMRQKERKIPKMKFYFLHQMNG